MANNEEKKDITKTYDLELLEVRKRIIVNLQKLSNAYNFNFDMQKIEEYVASELMVSLKITGKNRLSQNQDILNSLNGELKTFFKATLQSPEDLDTKIVKMHSVAKKIMEYKTKFINDSNDLNFKKQYNDLFRQVFIISKQGYNDYFFRDLKKLIETERIYAENKLKGLDMQIINDNFNDIVTVATTIVNEINNQSSIEQNLNTGVKQM